MPHCWNSHVAAHVMLLALVTPVFCNHLEEEEKAGCFAIIVLQKYCYYKCCVALRHGAVDWYAVCESGIS